MPTQVWSYRQSTALQGGARDIQAGVCLAMTYYVVKRHLAGLATTAQTLNGQVHRFMSMQRAFFWNRAYRADRTIAQVARGDSLRHGFGTSASLNASHQVALAATDQAAARIGVIIDAQWLPNDGGHAIGILWGGPSVQVFDANHGLYDSTMPDDDVQAFLRASWPGWRLPDRYDCVSVYGAPRDAASLAAD